MATSNGTGAPARLNSRQQHPREGEASATSRLACRRLETGTPQQAAATLRGELAIAIGPGSFARFLGTAQQLVDEGLLPADFKFPDAWQQVNVPNVRDLEMVSLRRRRFPRTGMSPTLVDNWSLHGVVPTRGSRNHLREEVARLLALDEYHRSPKWNEDFHRHWAAQSDAAFQRAMNFKGLAKAAKDAW